MNNQEVFNKVYRHLIAQNCKAKSYHRCAYRSKNGTKCAVGCLILDPYYDPIFEGQAPLSPLLTNALEKSGVTAKSMDLLYELQRIHDNRPVEQWPRALAQVAEKFGLAIP